MSTTNKTIPALGDLVRVDTETECYVDIISDLEPLEITTTPTGDPVASAALAARFRSGERVPLANCTLLLRDAVIQALGCAAGAPRYGSLDNILLFLEAARLIFGYESINCSLAVNEHEATISTDSYKLSLVNRQ